MPSHSTVILRDLSIETRIGTYGAGDVVPNRHLLDLTLTIDRELVLIAQDGMSHVFDYDPLIAQIDGLARDGHYETQERLLTRIVHACAGYPQIHAIDISLTKSPVLAGSGTLGVRLVMDADALSLLRVGTV